MADSLRERFRATFRVTEVDLMHTSRGARLWRRIWASRYLYLMFLPVFLYYVIFRYGPMLGLSIAFKDYNAFLGFDRSPWVGIKYFKQFFNSIYLWRLLRNTLLINLYDLVFNFPAAIILALLLNEVQQRRFKKTVQTITYIPHFISVVVMVGMMMQIFHPMIGLYGKFMKAVTGEMPGDLFASPGAFPHLYVWSGVWQNFGYNSIIYIAALTNVPTELHEAAEVDGASRFQRVLHIDFPALLPTITIMLILRSGSIMSVGFQKVYLMQTSLNLSRSEIISTYVYKVGLEDGDYSFSTAVGLFNSVVNFILIVSVNAITRRLSETSLW